MPGGPKGAYDLLSPILNKCAAQTSGSPCVTYCGAVGSGNYVKMVHNGIEYGDMQLIAEAYNIMKNVVQMGNEDMSARFAEWNKGELKVSVKLDVVVNNTHTHSLTRHSTIPWGQSYLIEITADILKKRDDKTRSGYVVDKIRDCTGMKGTGMWTVKVSEGDWSCVSINPFFP